MNAPPPLILASASRYRAELLGRLGIPFEAIAADVDETPIPGEPPQVLAERLAAAKARTLAVRHPQRWVLGSDQVCSCGGRPLGKPGDPETARMQLRAQSGQRVEFFNAMVLMRGADAAHHAHTDVTIVRFRTLSDAEIARYLAQEAVLDCAGAFKCEGLGISLFDAIESTDPTALVGLPLIALARLLRQTGCAVP